MLAKFVGLATKAMRVSDLSGLSSCFLYENRLQVVDLQPIFAERQVLETVVKYIIIMMWYFTLNILIYYILSPLLRQIKYY